MNSYEAQGCLDHGGAQVAAECRRRLARYSLTDQQLGQKYQMSFAKFERQRITEPRSYTWEVEADAMAWELPQKWRYGYAC